MITVFCVLLMQGTVLPGYAKTSTGVTSATPSATAEFSGTIATSSFTSHVPVPKNTSDLDPSYEPVNTTGASISPAGPKKKSGSDSRVQRVKYYKQPVCRLETQQLTLSHRNCSGLVSLHKCNGGCFSNSKLYWSAKEEFVVQITRRENCTCCQHSRHHTRTINVPCPNNKPVPIRVHEPLACKCKACA